MTYAQENTDAAQRSAPETQLGAEYYLTMIEESPFYQEGLHALRNNPRSSRHSYADDVAELKCAVAKQIAEQNTARQGHKELDEYALDVISHIHSFLVSNLRLDKLKHRHDDDSYHQKRQAVQTLAKFNRSVKELVYHNPDLAITETRRFITDINRAIHENDHHEYLEHEVSEALVGIAHELYTRQMLELLPGVEYKEGGIQDDMHGADLFVSINHSDYVPIDIKASEFTAEKKRQKAIIHGHDPHSIIDSKIPSEEVGNSFRISKKVAMRHKDELMEALELAVSSYYARKAQSQYS